MDYTDLGVYADDDAISSRRIIRLIKEHPCLYDKNNDFYTRREQTEEAWADISKKLNKDVHICKNKWKNIRTVFSRHINNRRMINKKRRYYLFDELRFILPHITTRFPTQSSNKDDSNFALNNENGESSSAPLQQETIQIKNEYDQDFESFSAHESDPASDLELPEPEISKSQDTLQTLSNFIKDNTNDKDRFEDESNEKCFLDLVKNQKDADEEFLHSLLPDVKLMDPRQKRQFKSKVLQVIQDILDNEINV